MKTKKYTKKDIDSAIKIIKNGQRLEAEKNETLMDVVREIRSIVKKLQPSDKVIIRGSSTRMVEPIAMCTNPNPSRRTKVCLNCGHIHPHGKRY